MNRFVLLGIVVSLILLTYKFILKRRHTSTASNPPEHAVMVHLKLSSNLGTAQELAAVRQLTTGLERVLRESGTGEYDGDEFGGGECVLYMYGPDADALFSSVAPTLRASALSVNGWALKRYGRATEPGVLSQREEL